MANSNVAHKKAAMQDGSRRLVQRGRDGQKRVLQCISFGDGVIGGLANSPSPGFFFGYYVQKERFFLWHINLYRPLCKILQ